MTKLPNFLPWQGVDYDGGIAGIRTLVLGESHYLADPGDAYPRLTIDIVTRVHEGGEHFPFFTKVRGILTNAVESPVSWSQVAFYNLVQQSVGMAARDRPTPAMFEAGVAPFETVLRQLTPQAVLVTGVGTWNALSSHWPAPATSSPQPGFDHVFKWQFSDTPPIMATWIDHPASFGFQPGRWTDRVRGLIQAASA
jgi:hypothetical protein